MKTICITGASSGIGQATAYWMAQRGHRLILCGRKEARLREVVEAFPELPIVTLTFDIRDAAAVADAIESLEPPFDKIDVLINNAGNAHGLDPLTDASIDDWDAMIDSNVKGLLYVSKAVMGGMKDRRSGHIVNVSSTAARQTYTGGVVYCASKRAVDVISEGMRIELTEYGIKVTNIQPGIVATEFSKVRFKGDVARAQKVYEGLQPLTPHDVADAIGYCVMAPSHVSIAELCLYPTAQAEPRTVYRTM